MVIEIKDKRYSFAAQWNVWNCAFLELFTFTAVLASLRILYGVKYLSETPATSTARDADYLLDDNYLFGQNNRVQSCAIALRSPASERTSDVKRIFTEYSHAISN